MSAVFENKAINCKSAFKYAGTVGMLGRDGFVPFRCCCLKPRVLKVDGRETSVSQPCFQTFDVIEGFIFNGLPRSSICELVFNMNRLFMFNANREVLVPVIVKDCVLISGALRPTIPVINALQNQSCWLMNKSDGPDRSRPRVEVNHTGLESLSVSLLVYHHKQDRLEKGEIEGQLTMPLPMYLSPLQFEHVPGSRISSFVKFIDDNDTKDIVCLDLKGVLAPNHTSLAFDSIRILEQLRAMPNVAVCIYTSYGRRVNHVLYEYHKKGQIPIFDRFSCVPAPTPEAPGSVQKGMLAIPIRRGRIIAVDDTPDKWRSLGCEAFWNTYLIPVWSGMGYNSDPLHAHEPPRPLNPNDWFVPLKQFLDSKSCDYTISEGYYPQEGINGDVCQDIANTVCKVRLTERGYVALSPISYITDPPCVRKPDA